MSTRTRFHLVRLTVLAAAMVVGMPAAAFAVGTAGTATITGGTLTLAPPTTANFAATLNGSDQDVTASQLFDVWDDTGSGAGWNITATSTTFTTGTHVLAATSVTISSTPTVTLDGGAGTGIVGTTNVSYPYTLPAGGTAPTATKLFNAMAGSGTGHQTVTATMHLAVPRATYAGVYTSTWTYSLVSGP